MSTINWTQKTGVWEVNDTNVTLITGVDGGVNTWATVLSDIEEKEIRRIEFNTYATGACILTRVNGNRSVNYQFTNTAVYKYLNGSTTSTTSFPHSYGSTNEIKVSIDFNGTKNIVKINDTILFEDDLTNYDYGFIGFSSYDNQPVNISNLTIIADRFIIKNETTNQYYSIIEKTLIKLPDSSIENINTYGTLAGKEIKLNEPFDTIITVNSDGTTVEEKVTPFLVYDYITESPIVIVYTESEDDIRVSTTTDKYTIYDEFTDEVEVLYYTDSEEPTELELLIESNYSPIDELEGDFRVITWNDESTTLNLTTEGVRNVKPTTVKAKGDISLYNVSEIESVNLTATGEGRVSVSTNGGITWMTFNGVNWVEISEESGGMRFSELNSLTSEQLSKLITESETLRFSYYITEDTEIDSIQMRVSMYGIEKLAETSDYTYRYDKNSKTIIYNINKAGTYSVNYLDAIQ